MKQISFVAGSLIEKFIAFGYGDTLQLLLPDRENLSVLTKYEEPNEVITFGKPICKMNQY